jgi:hypothetical protein
MEKGERRLRELVGFKVSRFWSQYSDKSKNLLDWLGHRDEKSLIHMVISIMILTMKETWN